MKQKLLELLNAKYLGKGVRKDGLAQLAGSLAITVTTEEEAQALVEKLTDEQVTEFVKDYRKEVDSEVSKGNKTYENSLKTKYDFVEKKNPTEPAPAAGNDDSVPTDVAAIVAKAIADAVKPLSEQIAAFKGAETTKTRFEKLQETLKDAPDLFKENTLKNFGRMKFENDEDFEAYVAETSGDLAKYRQDTTDEGLRKFGNPGVGGAKTDGKEMSAETKAYIEQKTAAGASDLGGKEV